MLKSPKNPKLKRIRALQERAKTRRQENAFVIEGVRLLEEAVAAQWGIRLVLYDRSLSERGKKLLRSLKNVELEEVDPILLKSFADTQNPQGILALLDAGVPFPTLDAPDFLLILDRIRDPGNLGTLLRTAAAAGVDEVILAPETTDAFAPKVLRAGMGAHFRLPVVSMDWTRIQNRTKGLTVFLADAAGDVTYTEADLKHACALIIGGEAEGASRSARDLAAHRLYIPMDRKTESLNAAVAGAVLLFEVVRQRR